jgi:hypothetical protein
MSNKHHHEFTGKFKSTKQVRGFAVNQHKPMIPPAMPSMPRTPAVPRAAPIPKKP